MYAQLFLLMPGPVRALFLLAASAAAAVDTSAQLILFRNGADGYPFVRIPSLLVINATLLLPPTGARRGRLVVRKGGHGRVTGCRK